jgi:hypothetical protein
MMPVARLIQDGPLLWANGGGAEDAGKLSGELSIPLRRRNLEGRFVLYLERHRARDKAFLGGGIVQAATLQIFFWHRRSVTTLASSYGFLQGARPFGIVE